MGIAQPRQWLETAHPEGVQLESAMLAPQQLQQIDASLEARPMLSPWNLLSPWNAASSSGRDAVAAWPG